MRSRPPLWHDAALRERLSSNLGHLDEIDAAVSAENLNGSLPMMGTVVYAPTGEILRRLVVVGLHGRPPGRSLDEPRFAWR